MLQIMAFPPKDPGAKHLLADHCEWPNMSFPLIRNYLADFLLKTPFFMKSKNITFLVICINPDFLPEVPDFLMRKQETFVWTKHLRFENTERGRESESNRGAFGSQRASPLKPQGPLRNPDKAVHTKVGSHTHSPSRRWEQPKHPASRVNKLWSTHTAAACCMGNQRPMKLTLFLKGWKRRLVIMFKRGRKKDVKEIFLNAKSGFHCC